ncbi:hypothetical protein ACFRK5_19695 [Streptomyces niveus]|uniref:hypothetical protein n=1 Tax=Streptomyces niveus TaxID=193462 RepID=UPI0036B1EF0F
MIMALLLGANATQPGAVACLRLAGARVSGRLNLAGAQIAHALWLEDCWFEELVDLLGASTQTLVITGSQVPGIEAASARIGIGRPATTTTLAVYFWPSSAIGV